MSLSASEDLALNTFSGRVILEESGVGIPNLLVVLFSPASSARIDPTGTALRRHGRARFPRLGFDRQEWRVYSEHPRCRL